MTTGARDTVRPVFILRQVFSSRYTLWLAFVGAHLWLGWLNLYPLAYGFGDVRYVYKAWVDQIVVSDYWVGIDGPFVYPILAIAPMLLAFVFGSEFYSSTWLSMVMVLDAAAFVWLIGWGRTGRNIGAAWWWVGFLVLLGPISTGRIDAITVPLGIIGVLLLATRPRAASVVLSLATWIKVWPAAILAAALIATRQRGALVSSAVLVSLGIVAIALVYGSGLNVFSFITEQTGRGLQVEAPVSTIWLWMAAAGVHDTFVYFDTDLITYQIVGPGADVASSLMTPVLAIAALVTCGLGLLAMRRRTPVAELLPVLSLGLVVCLIAFNKVGSPQYMTWLAVPIVLGLTRGVAFRTPAVLALVIGVLTQLVYPLYYDALLTLNPVMLVVITVRNLLLFVIFAWAISRLWKSARGTGVDFDDATGLQPAAAWPFRPAAESPRSSHQRKDTSV